MRRAALLTVLLLAGWAMAQSERPALTTRKDFANSNLLFAQEDVIGSSEVTRHCIRIQPDGRFHREKSEAQSKAKFGEAGQLSETELSQVKDMIDDPEFKTYRQDPDAFPKTARLQIGYEIFSLSIVRDGFHPQDLFFINDPKTTAEPPKLH